ncbi:MAG TPA: hypothetical protein DE060_05285 [Lentisphaeria bacterium]|nr:hypothetical protein [Lentisphaeria bacterium]HCG48608.1 hypothetical protein [Lentisphaeria bacterium]
MKKIGLISVVCCITLCLNAVEVTKEGKPASAIVIPAKPEKSVQYAAFELQHHFRLMTGCTVPIVREGEKFSGQPIYLGKTLASADAGLEVGKLKREEYLVAVRTDAAYLAGVDDEEYGSIEYGNQSALPPLEYHNHGTLWAVYDFLRQGCGFEWYAPGDNGITYQKHTSLSVAPFTLRRHPFMKAFRMIYAPKIFKAYGQPYTPYEVQQLKLRWKQTIRYGIVNHNIYGIWIRFYAPCKSPWLAKYFEKKHPEYFAQNYKGASRTHLIAMRSQYPDDEQLPPQLCNTNKDVIRILAQEAVDRSRGKKVVGVSLSNQVKKMKDEPFYYPIQPDDNHGYCRCADCLKLFPDKYRDGQRPDNYIHFEWMSKIAREAGKKAPDAGIGTLAYNTTTPYPEGLDLPSNLSVMIVLNMSNFWHRLSRQRTDHMLDGWIANEKDKRLLTVWLHLLAPAWDARIVYKYNDFFPGYYYHEFARHLRKMTDGGVMGYFIESGDEISVPFWYQHLELYLASRLADDPSLNPEKLRDDFFRSYYGAAAQPMRQFYDLIEYAYMNPSNYPGDQLSRFNTLGAFQSEEVNWGKCGTKERMKQLGRFLTQADRLADTPEVRERLRLLREGMWNPMLRGRARWEEKEKYINRPVLSAEYQPMPEAGGNLKKVDWNRAAKIDSWRTIDGFPFSLKAKLLCAVDKTHLYLRYEEQGNEFSKGVKSLWEGDHLEIFLASQGALPVHQLCIGANGMIERYGHYYKNDAAYSTAWNYGPEPVVQTENGRLFMETAIPLRSLRTGSGKEIRLNLFRVFPGGKKGCWSPIFVPAHNTPERMGRIVLRDNF